jgi:peptidoglycan-associated lipoprotein
MSYAKTFFFITSLCLVLVTAGCKSDFTGTEGDDAGNADAGSTPPPFGNVDGLQQTPDDMPTGWSEPGVSADSIEAGSKTADGDNWKRLPGIDLPSIYFSYDKDMIGTSEKNKLEQVAQYLKENSVLGLIIEGNCDERGSQEYNRALGERRALNVKKYLLSLGIAEERLRTISFGEDNPAVQGTGESIWRQNRRADLVLAKIQ